MASQEHPAACACGTPLVTCEKCGDSRCLDCDPYSERDTCGDRVAATEPRGWVKRLGSYLFIFGGRGNAGQPEHRAYIDRLAVMAKEREAEHGR